MTTGNYYAQSKERSVSGRLRSWLGSLLALSLLAAACGTVTPEAGMQTSPLAAASPLPGTAAAPTASPTAVPTATAIPTATPLPAPAWLVVLHTNDNWGETEPCG
jgi:hypothetical protein